MTRLFEGKKILILGVANERSIAYGISQALIEHGAEIALTYMNEAIERRVRPIAQELGCKLVLPCDVQSDGDIDALMTQLGSTWGQIDGIVHSIAFADRVDLQNPFYKTSREGFKLALDVSAYSLVALAGRALPLMREHGGSIVTLSYLGAERAVKNYNVMGVAKAALESAVRYLAFELGESNIRVNAISAGPIKTLAASGIPHFKELLSQFAASAPLKRNVSLEDVAGTALYLLSSLSSGVTAEVTHVDCGFSTVGIG